MQLLFDLGDGPDIAHLRDTLRDALGPARDWKRLDPVSQLVKSSISSRTKDEDSWPAFHRLVRRFPSWDDLTASPPSLIEGILGETVTFKDAKASRLGEALRDIKDHSGAYDLDFLGAWSVESALTWLQQLPNVGIKVAASVLNFSTLRRPAFVIDTHVLRILARYGIVRANSTVQKAYETVMCATPSWSAQEYFELHVLMKDLGKQVCQAQQPICWKCPLIEECRAARPVAA